MGLFDMFSGHKARLQLIETERQQFMLQQQLIQRENERSAEAQRQFDEQSQIQQRMLAEQKRANKAADLDQAVAQLGGSYGFRSLLAGRKGGGGFGPRSMLDAA